MIGVEKTAPKGSIYYDLENNTFRVAIKPMVMKFVVEYSLFINDTSDDVKISSISYDNLLLLDVLKFDGCSVVLDDKNVDKLIDSKLKELLNTGKVENINDQLKKDIKYLAFNDIGAYYESTIFEDDDDIFGNPMDTLTALMEYLNSYDINKISDNSNINISRVYVDMLRLYQLKNCIEIYDTSRIIFANNPNTTINDVYKYFNDLEQSHEKLEWLLEKQNYTKVKSIDSIIGLFLNSEFNIIKLKVGNTSIPVPYIMNPESKVDRIVDNTYTIDSIKIVFSDVGDLRLSINDKNTENKLYIYFDGNLLSLDVIHRILHHIIVYKNLNKDHNSYKNDRIQIITEIIKIYYNLVGNLEKYTVNVVNIYELKSFNGNESIIEDFKHIYHNVSQNRLVDVMNMMFCVFDRDRDICDKYYYNLIKDSLLIDVIKIIGSFCDRHFNVIMQYSSEYKKIFRCDKGAV
ncbi:hypothetical protein RCL1_006210 [Eukaryota sp. TZLM3-RCL]